MRLGSRLPAFTFPEALVTMALMVFFAAIVGGLFFQGRSMAERMDRHDQYIQEKLDLASYLPAFCQEISPPEWVSQDQVFRKSALGLEVKYWDSDPKKMLRIETSNGRLVVHTPQGSWRWKTLGSMSVEYWKSSDRIVGLVVSWSEGGEKKTLHLPWGSRPL